MKKSIIVFAVLSMASVSCAAELVNGYVRQDGTIVSSYYRSSPNNTTQDNYSTQGNTNPYTGNLGTVPATPPAPQWGSALGDNPRRK